MAASERRDALVERLFEAVLGFNDLHAVYLGDRLGLFSRRRPRGRAGEVRAGASSTFYGDRCYSAKDPEGHRWSFAKQVKDVAPEDWGATTPTG
jgi:hypothetical protein